MKRKTFQEWLDRWVGAAFQRPPDPTVAPEGAGPLEQQARRALRWYAPSWREAHGDELVATVLDAAPERASLEASKLSRSTRLDLALGGLRQRRRARPSFMVRWRLTRGKETFSWEGLAWLRDSLDQRGFACRRVTYVAVVSAVYAVIFSTESVSWAHGLALLPLRVLLVYWLGLAAILFVLVRLFSALHRKNAIERAGLNESGWPRAWSQAPPFTPVWSGPPPALRWVVGELRLALATCIVGGMVATSAAYLFISGQSEPAKPLGMSVAPHIADLAWLAFVVAGACLIIGMALTPGVVGRARVLLRPEGRPRSLASLPLTSQSGLRHRVPRISWPVAAFLAAAPAVPMYGWALGAIEVAAIPIVVVVLVVVRRAEQETGVAIHQRQVAAAIGGRFWSDQWMPADPARGPSVA